MWGCSACVSETMLNESAKKSILSKGQSRRKQKTNRCDKQVSLAHNGHNRCNPMWLFALGLVHPLNQFEKYPSSPKAGVDEKKRTAAASFRFYTNMCNDFYQSAGGIIIFASRGGEDRPWPTSMCS